MKDNDRQSMLMAKAFSHRAGLSFPWSVIRARALFFPISSLVSGNQAARMRSCGVFRLTKSKLRPERTRASAEIKKGEAVMQKTEQIIMIDTDSMACICKLYLTRLLPGRELERKTF